MHAKPRSPSKTPKERAPTSTPETPGHLPGGIPSGGDPLAKTPKKQAPRRRPQWWEPFEGQIIEYCIKPLLIQILQVGVNAKSDLIRHWENTTGVRVSQAQMDGWLEATGLDAVFSETRRFQLQPGPDLQYPPQAFNGPTSQRAPEGRYQLPHRNPQQQIPEEQLPPHIRPIIPGLSRMPGGPPPRTMITDQGPMQVPIDTFM